MKSVLRKHYWWFRPPRACCSTRPPPQRWSAEAHLVFACGRYEGIDQRVVDDAARRMRVEEVSIGDYVLPGGESAALVMIEAVLRLLAGVSGQSRVASRGFAFAGRWAACWKGRATRGRRAGVASTSPTFCYPVTTRESPPGAARSRCSAPANVAPTWSPERGDQIRPLGNIVLTALGDRVPRGAVIAGLQRLDTMM